MQLKKKKIQEIQSREVNQKFGFLKKDLFMDLF